MHVELKLSKVDVSEALRRYVARRLHFSLGRFAERVGRLDVQILGSQHMHGSRNQCRIDAEIVPFGRVSVEESSPDMHAAIDRATTRIGRLFAQELARIRDLRVGRESIRAA
ncbi:MAG TPA: HPF/RaiA family ribosome-associated protein [Terriglobales bacterium]|nr:HPF/RaiA family ribosome-associated protein [Terriglobales bacterium]